MMSPAARADFQDNGSKRELSNYLGQLGAYFDLPRPVTFRIYDLNSARERFAQSTPSTAS